MPPAAGSDYPVVCVDWAGGELPKLLAEFADNSCEGKHLIFAAPDVHSRLDFSNYQGPKIGGERKKGAVSGVEDSARLRQDLEKIIFIFKMLRV